MVPRGQGKEVKLLSLHNEGQTGKGVREAADDYHEERTEGKRGAKEDVQKNRPDLRPTSARKEVPNILPQILEY